MTAIITDHRRIDTHAVNIRIQYSAELVAEASEHNLLQYPALTDINPFSNGFLLKRTGTGSCSTESKYV